MPVEIDSPPAPVLTFPPPPPPPRLKYEVVPEPPKRGSRDLRIIDVFIGLALLAFVVLAVVGTVSGWQQQTSAPIASSHGQVQPSCPASLQTFATCWGLDLPASGEWVRWIKPTSLPYTITTVKGVEGRGCKGEIYDLGKGGNKLNSTCGYIEYRSTDRQTHSVYIGVK